MTYRADDALQEFIDHVAAARALAAVPGVADAVGAGSLMEFQYFVSSLKARFPERMPGGQRRLGLDVAPSAPAE